MKPVDRVSASRLATTLLNRSTGEIYATAASNADLVIEWLAELMTAKRSVQDELDVLSEAIDDLKGALHYARGPETSRMAAQLART
jgi:hypothetical protein